jgi:hypothetical protein
VTQIEDLEAIDWLPSTLRDGVRMGRIGKQIVVEWRGIGRFHWSGSDSDGTFVAAAGADGDALKKFQATSLLACRRYLAGALSLHGSAVSLGDGAVVFLGDCNAGKSTTAMALVERHGGGFLADDVVPIDWHGNAPVVCPVDDSFWLAGDASSWFGMKATAAHKCPYPPRERAAAAERLRVIVHLIFDESVGRPQLRPVTGDDAFIVLSEGHVCYSTGADEDALRNLASRARLAQATAIYRLRRSRSLDALGPAIQLLQECCGVGSRPRPV